MGTKGETNVGINSNAMGANVQVYTTNNIMISI